MWLKKVKAHTLSPVRLVPRQSLNRVWGARDLSSCLAILNTHAHTHAHAHAHTLTELHLSEGCVRDFPGGPVVKTPPSKAGVTGSGTEIPHAAEELSPDGNS